MWAVIFQRRWRCEVTFPGGACAVRGRRPVSALQDEAASDSPRTTTPGVAGQLPYPAIDEFELAKTKNTPQPKGIGDRP
jgi:hypothetical protein